MEQRVVGLKEGAPLQQGALRIWPHFQGLLSLSTIELSAEADFGSHDRDEVLYDLERDTGIYVPAGSSVTLQGPATLISSQVPATPSGRTPEFVRLEDQPVQRTGDRWYRELIQAEVTQFVGSIPPGRAPDHFHEYEEVICILRGSGVLWTDGRSTPIAAGSCIFLPRRQVHCLENSGDSELRLLGVFYPAGSPAVRYVQKEAGQRPERG